jgi:addiction module RelE/StbE family toxin
VKIRYSTRALAQLDEIYSYIAEHDRSASRRVQARIKRSIDRLADFPHSGRETSISGVRLLSVIKYPYLIFYMVDATAGEVHILRIRHGARDPSRHLD